MQCEGSYSCSVLSKLIKYLRKYLTCTCLYLFSTGTKYLTQVPAGTKYLIRYQVLLIQVHCTLYLGSVQGTKYRARSTRSFVRYKSTCIVPGTAVTGTVLTALVKLMKNECKTKRVFRKRPDGLPVKYFSVFKYIYIHSYISEKVSFPWC